MEEMTRTGVHKTFLNTLNEYTDLVLFNVHATKLYIGFMMIGQQYQLNCNVFLLEMSIVIDNE